MKIAKSLVIMKPMEKQKVIYYEDELKDEFSPKRFEPPVIDGSYPYEGGRFFRLGRMFYYYVLARPLGWLFLKVKYGHRIVNRSCLKECGAQGYFLYGNHTNAVADPFVPSMLTFPKGVFVIVNPENLVVPVIGKINHFLGALPLPGDFQAMTNFTKTIHKRIAQKKCVTIYPEAHIWPYYTKIRPFKADSFGFAVQEKAPVYCFTNTYRKRRWRKTPRLVTYVDGPFYVQEEGSKRQQKMKLRDEVYQTMVKRSRENTVEVIKYIKKDKTNV